MDYGSEGLGLGFERSGKAVGGEVFFEGVAEVLYKGGVEIRELILELSFSMISL